MNLMDDATIERTRQSLHAVAELVMAGPQYRESGTIRLYVTHGGFETRADPRLAIDDEHLVVEGNRYPLTGLTIADLAALAGVDPQPAGIYRDGANADPDDPVEVDPAVARWLFDAFNVGHDALKAFDSSADPVLWPEHFDVGILVDDVAYGVSPGDHHIGVPYAYVSANAPDDDPYWNVSFGAARRVSELKSAEAITEFFSEGQRRLT